MGKGFVDSFNRFVGKQMDANFRAMRRLGFFSDESIDRRIAAEEKDRKFGEEHPELWIAKHLGKHAAISVLKPFGGEILA